MEKALPVTAVNENEAIAFVGMQEARAATGRTSGAFDVSSIPWPNNDYKYRVLGVGLDECRDLGGFDAIDTTVRTWRTFSKDGRVHSSAASCSGAGSFSLHHQTPSKIEIASLQSLV